MGTRKLEVLHGIDLSVHAGEFVAIMGPSGSGKSTLLHLLGCLDMPTSGTLEVDGINAGGLSSDELAGLRARKIGFVFQAFNLLGNFSAQKNVELAMAITESPKQTRARRAAELLAKVGLSERVAHVPSELSGGEKQRVAIARALANAPSLLLMDEPTGNLDSASGAEIMRFVRELWKKQGLTVLLITHERTVAQYAQKIIHLRDGNIERVETLSKKEVREK